MTRTTGLGAAGSTLMIPGADPGGIFRIRFRLLRLRFEGDRAIGTSVAEMPLERHTRSPSALVTLRAERRYTPPIDTDRLILIVVGAHIRAEVSDRPLAYRLAAKLTAALEESPDADDPPHVVVCSDIWWLNNDALRARPTISVGNPDVNALTAFLADKLPFVFSIQGQLGVQMDLEFVDPWATCWGVSERTTTQAVEAFEQKYLAAFVKGSLAHRA